jgi:predicted HAD superfamily phosphohydrolase YqeG
MVADDQGAKFGPEMTVLANSVKSRIGLWHKDVDVPFYYTVPNKALAPKITQPKIKGANTAVEIGDWLETNDAIKAVTK